MAYTLPLVSPTANAFGGGNAQLLQTILQLVGQSSGGRAEARQANESRYNDILKLFGDNRQRALDSLDSISGQQVADANKTYGDMRGNLIADLANRGLSGSTKRIAVESMTQREKDAAVNRIKDTLVQNRNAADQGFTDRATGVMERRTDAYPAPTDISSIIGQLGPLLGGAGGGGVNALAQLLGGGGAFGSSTGGGFGGGQQAIHNNAPGQVLPPAVPDAPGNVANRRIAMANQVQNSAANEQQRRNALASLHTADHVGGLSNAAPLQSLLDYMQANGLANWNPAAGTPDIRRGNEQTIYVPHNPAQNFPSGSGGGARYAQPQQGNGRFYDQSSDQPYATSAADKNAQQNYVNSQPGNYNDMMASAYAAANQNQQPKAQPQYSGAPPYQGDNAAYGTGQPNPFSALIGHLTSYLGL